MKKLFIVRHGETVDNVSLIIQGQTQGQLTPNGYRQAELLAARLKNEKIDRIFSSDLSRSKETTEAIIREVPLAIEFRADLRERAFGEFEGRTIEEYQIYASSSMQSFDEVKPPGGESIQEMLSRCHALIEYLKSNCREQSVLLSAHGSLNRALIIKLLGLGLEKWKSIDQDNTCVNTFNFDPDGSLREYTLNCTSHLVSNQRLSRVSE